MEDGNDKCNIQLKRTMYKREALPVSINAASCQGVRSCRQTVIYLCIGNISFAPPMVQAASEPISQPDPDRTEAAIDRRMAQPMPRAANGRGFEIMYPACHPTNC